MSFASTQQTKPLLNNLTAGTRDDNYDAYAGLGIHRYPHMSLGILYSRFSLDEQAEDLYLYLNSILASWFKAVYIHYKATVIYDCSLSND